MHIQRQADSFAYRMAAEEWDSYDLPSLWEDFQMWYGADDPEQAKEGITYWKNVEDYLSENHGLPSTGDPDSTMRNTLPDEEWENHYYSHPATIGMAKLHSLAQGKNTFDGDPNWSTFDDDDVLQGAALGLLQIRRDRQGRPRTENGYYTTTATRNIQSHNTIRCAADDYRGYHRGPDAEYGASMDNPDMMFPDIDTHPEYYDTNEPYDYESHHQIRRVRGKPDAWVTVYRALPFSVIQNKTYRGGPNDLYEGSKPYRYRQREAPINTNDWVTPSYSYAKEHGESNLSNEPWTIVQQRVRARSLFSEGNSIHEWAYNGEPIVGTEGDRARRERGLRTRNRLSHNTIRCAISPSQKAKTLDEMSEPDLHLPIDEVRQYANKWYGPQLKSQWFFDTAQYPGLRKEVEQNGIQRPLEIATDGRRAQLWDGYHRLALADHLGHETVPVKIIRRPPSWFTGPRWFNDLKNEDEHFRYAPTVPVGEGLRAHLQRK